MKLTSWCAVLRPMLALAIGLSALTAASANAAESVRLAQNLAPISGLVIVAQAQGFFKKNGLDVTVINVTSGRAALEAVLGGSADIATTAEAPITAAVMAQQKIALLARMEYSDDKTLTRTASNIKTLADLKGKRIAYTAGTGSEIYTIALLAKAGLKPADVKLVNLRPEDMPAALASNSIDAYDTWEPFITNGQRILGADAAPLDSRGVYAETFNLVAMQGYLSAHQDTVVKFLRATLEAETYLKAHPKEAIKDIAAVTKMPEADLTAIWKDYVFELTLDKRTMDTLQHHAQWRISSGNAPAGVTTVPDFNTIVFSDPLKQVSPDRVTVPGK